MTWHKQANCADLAPMFDDDMISAELFDICDACPVRLTCYEHIMSQPRDYDYGIWAGLGRQQRLRIRDKRSHYVKEYMRNVRQFA